MSCAQSQLRMRLRPSAQLLALSLATVFGSQMASAQASRPVQDTVKRLDDIVARELERQGLPGLQVAVGSNDRIVYSRAVGKADVENDLALMNASLIRTGSIAKSISAVAAMTLVETGKLDLDAPVRSTARSFQQSHGQSRRASC